MAQDAALPSPCCPAPAPALPLPGCLCQGIVVVLLVVFFSYYLWCWQRRDNDDELPARLLQSRRVAVAVGDTSRRPGYTASTSPSPRPIPSPSPSLSPSQRLCLTWNAIECLRLIGMPCEATCTEWHLCIVRTVGAIGFCRAELCSDFSQDTQIKNRPQLRSSTRPRPILSFDRSICRPIDSFAVEFSYERLISAKLHTCNFKMLQQKLPSEARKNSWGWKTWGIWTPTLVESSVQRRLPLITYAHFITARLETCFSFSLELPQLEDFAVAQPRSPAAPQPRSSSQFSILSSLSQSLSHDNKWKK